MKTVSSITLFLLLVGLVSLSACGGQSAAPPAASPVPTTVPLQAVEEAILAANESDYDRANQLLDISNLAQDSSSEAITEYWDWLTSNQRVSDISIAEEESTDEAIRLFITIQNDNYPTQNVGFWIRWETDRWVGFEEDN